MPSSSLRAIFFDAGNTLLRIDYAAIAAALADAGVRATPASVQRAEWRARVRFDAGFDGLTSTETPAARGLYLRYILESLGVRDEATLRALDEWRHGYNVPFGFWDIADPDAEAALVLSRSAGLRVGVISNSNGSIRAILDKVGLGRHLDFVLDSGEVGAEKPDPRIFRLALEKAGVTAAEAVHIGDLYSVDVRGARSVGMEAVLLSPGGGGGGRDCATAAGPLAAVRFVLAGRGGATQGA